MSSVIKSKNMKILHVDDEADIRDITQLSLELDPGFDVASVASAAAALDRIPDFAPDIILLDVMMPEMDGPVFLNVLRSRSDTAGIPVIFMTASAQLHMVDELRSMGAAGVITKPFDPMVLAKDVKKISEACLGT